MPKNVTVETSDQELSGNRGGNLVVYYLGQSSYT